MSAPTPPIAILGAGPSGLTLACLLTVRNIPYVVYERDASPTSAGPGGSLDLHMEDGQLALKECGLFPQFQKLARYDGQAFKSVDKHNNILVDDHPTDDEDGRPEIDRKQLRDLLLSGVPSQNIQWGKKVQEIEKEADGSMQIRFVNGSVEKGFKLVVGADGAWSKARNLITSAKPSYYGLCYLQTRISPSNPHHAQTASQVGRGLYFAASEGKAIIAQRVSNDSYNVYVGLPLPQDWSKTNAELFQSPKLRDYLVDERFAGWSKEITDLIAKSDDEQFYCWTLNTMDSASLNWESKPGVTLIGDAAHLALPNGDGVNCGMLDSLQLARAIEECGLENLDEAVRKYEAEMKPRGAACIDDGKSMSKIFFAEDSPKDLMGWFKEVGMIQE